MAMAEKESSQLKSEISALKLQLEEGSRYYFFAIGCSGCTLQWTPTT
jgi:hypothetical protein